MRREFPPGRRRCPYCWQYLIVGCKKRACPGRGHWPPLAGGDPWAEALREDQTHEQPTLPFKGGEAA